MSAEDVPQVRVSRDAMVTLATVNPLTLDRADAETGKRWFAAFNELLAAHDSLLEEVRHYRERLGLADELGPEEAPEVESTPREVQYLRLKLLLARLLEEMPVPKLSRIVEHVGGAAESELSSKITVHCWHHIGLERLVADLALRAQGHEVP